jgi:hypothetical protein
VTERNATIHAAARLVDNHTLLAAFIDFFPVHDSNRYRATLGSLALGGF